MKLAWIALLISPALRAQEDLKKIAGEAAQALKQTAKSGSFEFAGSLKTEINPEDKDAEATECKVSGAAATPFQTSFRVKSDKSTSEIAHKGGKTAGRQAWRSNPLDLGKGPGEVLSLVNLDRLAIYAEKATSAKAGADEKVAGSDCRALELVLPKGTIRSHQEDAEAAEEDEKSVESVDLKLKVRKSDGLIVKLEAVVHRFYKDEENPNESSKGISSYSFTLKEFGSAKVTVPAELEKVLGP